MLGAAALADDRKARSRRASDRPVIHDVPPGSTLLRELAHAIDLALALLRPASRDEAGYLPCVRDRVRMVRGALQRILADPETDDGDVMTTVAVLRSQAEHEP